MSGTVVPVATEASRRNTHKLSVLRCTTVDVSDDQPAPDDVSVLDRLLGAGLSLQRIEQHLGVDRACVDGNWSPTRISRRHHLHGS